VNLNGKDPTFDAGFAVPGVGRNPEATGLLDRSGHRDLASRISTLKITGPYVYCPRALRMPTPRLAPRYMSKTFCAAIMI
jgi:hypothetical protein